jgi:hypothetical protein
MPAYEVFFPIGGVGGEEPEIASFSPGEGIDIPGGGDADGDFVPFALWEAEFTLLSLELPIAVEAQSRAGRGKPRDFLGEEEGREKNCENEMD